MENNNTTTIGAMIGAIKIHLDKTFGKDTERLQIAFDYKNDFIVNFYGFANDPGKYESEKQKLSTDTESTALSEMFLTEIKNRLEYKQIDFFRITMDLKKLEISRTQVYYISTDGKKEVWDSKEQK